MKNLIIFLGIYYVTFSWGQAQDLDRENFLKSYESLKGNYKDRTIFLRKEIGKSVLITEAESLQVPVYSFSNPLSASLLERNQTWWGEDGAIFIFLLNKTNKKINEIAINFSGAGCDRKMKSSVYKIKFFETLESQAFTVLKFQIPETLSKGTSNCLDIVDVNPPIERRENNNNNIDMKKYM